MALGDIGLRFVLADFVALMIGKKSQLRKDRIMIEEKGDLLIVFFTGADCEPEGEIWTEIKQPWFKRFWRWITFRDQHYCGWKICDTFSNEQTPVAKPET